MNTVTVSCPGKVHLMGEHVVVYGKPALLTTVNKRLSVSISDAEKKQIDVSAQEAASFISYALDIVEKEYNLSSNFSYAVSVSSDIPFGYHLGSSASLAAATVGAYIYFRKKIWNPTEINRLAYEVEKKQHGNPSGGDNTAVIFGGLLWYRKELEFLKSLWQLPFSLPVELQHLYLINTGKPEESTGEMVARVKDAYATHQERFDRLFAENELCTKQIAAAIKNNDERQFLDGIQRGQKTLEGIGVVSSLVIPCIREIEKSGGAAKILGGGGSKNAVGFLLAYHKEKHVIEQIAKQYAWNVEEIQLGEEGIRLESGRS